MNTQAAGISIKSRPPRRRGLIVAAVVVPVLLVFLAAVLAMIPVAITSFSALAMTGGPSATEMRTAADRGCRDETHSPLIICGITATTAL